MAFTAMHYPVFEHKDTLSFAFLVCIILYTDGKQFMCSIFTFVQYISEDIPAKLKNTVIP